MAKHGETGGKKRRAENKSNKTTTWNQGHRSLPKESWGRARWCFVCPPRVINGSYLTSPSRAHFPVTLGAVRSWPPQSRKRSTLVSYDWSRDAPASCLISLTAAIYPASSPFSLHLCELRGSPFPSPSTLSQVRFIPLNHLLPFILDFPCFYPPNITRMWPLLHIPTPSGAAHHHLLPR